MKDVILTGAALLVLFGALVSINPRMREHTAQFASNPQWDTVGEAVQHTIRSSTSIVHGYAGDNTYLFTFLVAACVFVALMLKVIS